MKVLFIFVLTIEVLHSGLSAVCLNNYLVQFMMSVNQLNKKKLICNEMQSSHKAYLLCGCFVRLCQWVAALLKFVIEERCG